jgi:hypothetical protein
MHAGEKDGISDKMQRHFPMLRLLVPTPQLKEASFSCHTLYILSVIALISVHIVVTFFSSNASRSGHALT